MDEIFGRANYRNSIIVRKGTKNVSVQFDTVERLNAGYDTILMYSKNSDLRIPNLFAKIDSKDIKGAWNNHWRGTDRPTMRYELFGITPHKGQWRWSKERTYKAVENYIVLVSYFEERKIKYVTQEEFDKGYDQYLKANNITDSDDFGLVRLSKNGKPEHYIPPNDKKLLSENWLDLSVAGRLTDFEHEKNEAILQRIFEWITCTNDIVLDSFLGSGTTAAVAQKMGRRWIGVEMEEHCFTHAKPRLDETIKQAGGYDFYELAPSIINIDKIGMPVISNEYNAEMLAAAMAKHENYTYNPDSVYL
jgi:adenine-specific DNA-methyltransferase